MLAWKGTLGRNAHTLSVRKTLKHVGHILVGIEGVDGVHNLGVVGGDLHIAEDLVAVLICAQATVELTGEAVQTVTGSVHIGPSHGKGQVGVGKRTINDAASEARNITTSALAITTETSLGVKDGRVLHILVIGIDGPVPVRLDTLVVALIPEKILMKLDEPTVPGKEVGDKVDFGVEFEVGVDEVVHAGCDGVDVGVLLLGKVARADGSSEVFLLFGTGEFTPFLSDDGIFAGVGGACERAGERCGGKGQAEKSLDEHFNECVGNG